MRKTGLALLTLICAVAAYSQTPAVFDGGVVNAASFAPGQVVTPGSLVSIFGTELTGALALADSIPLATQLLNVSVTFNNIPAPLVAVIPGGSAQINAQLPWDVLPAGQKTGTANVVVTRGGVSSAPKTVQVGPFSPGIFAVNFGIGPAIAILPDGALAAPAGSIPGLATRPAKVGDVLEVLATGLGQVDISVANGHNSLDHLRQTTTKPTALVGGVPVTVEFSGLSPQFVGVNQVNIKIDNPNVPKGNAVPLQLQVGGITSTNKVTIAIE